MGLRFRKALCLAITGIGAVLAGGAVELHVGNAVRAWPGRDPEGVAILDSGLCFPQKGSVVAVEAYIHAANQSGAWPIFYAVESVEGRTWLVHAEARAIDGEQTNSVGAMRLELEPPLPVEQGQCLCWRYPRPARGVVAFAAWPGEPWAGPPGGVDAAAIALFGQVPRSLRMEESFTFERARRRRYALRACLVAPEGSLAAMALGHVGRGPREPGPLPAITEQELGGWAVRCWGEGWAFSSQPLFCCLPAGKGKPMCFDGELSYARCCSADVVGALGFNPQAATLREPLRVRLVDDGGAPRALPRVKVDMFVRTYHQKFEELTLLLRSAALFWPLEWGAVVALDGESEPDALACKLLPAWVRCVLIDPPAFLGRMNLSFPMLGGSGRGMVWKEWSECWADLYSSADFIAIMDSDVVLTTFGIPHLLFEEASDRQLQPVIWGHSHENYFPSTVEELKLPNLVDFMDSFPLTIRRADFSHIRRQITSLYGRPGRKTARSASSFNWAFLAYVEAVHAASVAKGGGGECPSFHSMAGSLLWYGRRGSYAWYIRHGHLAGVPLRFTCPRLRVAYHVPYWAHENTEHYQVPSLKPHLRLVAPLGSLGYTARAVALIMAGLCEVPWQQRQGLQRRLDQRTAFASSTNDTAAFDMKGMEDVHRDFCEHGMQLVAGISDPFQRLLSWRFPASPVSDEEAAYCGDRRPSALLREYRRLMGSVAFTPE